MNYDIGIYAEKVECITYSIVYSVYRGGYNIVLITDRNNFENKQHQKYLKKITEIPNTKVVNLYDLALDLDLMYIDFTQSISRKHVLRWGNKAQKVGAVYSISNRDLIQNYTEQIKAIVKYFPLSLKYTNIVMLNDFYQLDPLSLLAKKHRFGFDVHANFLQNRELLDLMFAFEWCPKKQRKYKLNFLGNKQPDIRNNILQNIKNYLKVPKQHIETNFSDLESDLFWLEYDANTLKKKSLPAKKYIDLLTDSDFTLCPPGYISLTHRVIEALVRGSIPIINENELKLYDINLEDKVNCIAVKNNDWVTAVKEAFILKIDRLYQMRSNILNMKNDYLLPEATARRLRQKLISN